MKRILIVSHALELGGAERSLIGLLDSLDTDKYDIDLFLLRHEGELLMQIPDGINLLPSIPAYTVLARPMKDTLREGHVLLTAARLYAKQKAKSYCKKRNIPSGDVELEYSHKYTYKIMPKIQPGIKYDLAISFLTPHYIVANKVCAKTKIAWIHTDYTHIYIDERSEMAMWSAYDHIISISPTVSKSFIEVFPSLASKIMLVENILPEKLIRKQAAEFNVNEEMSGEESVAILSIGRYCTAKNFDNIPDICSRILSKGLPVRWYIIGFGGDEALIQRKIKEAKMDDFVILLGKKENPYPYILNCDLYVQPSRFEGKCVTVREAQMLGKPVVITNYATSASQLEDGVDGVIVPMDNDGCAAGIAALINDPARMDCLRENCKTRDYSNYQEVQKVCRLLGNE